jgi:hypothetical protein
MGVGVSVSACVCVCVRVCVFCVCAVNLALVHTLSPERASAINVHLATLLVFYI